MSSPRSSRVAPSKQRAPLITVAKARYKDEALAGLERWKKRHPKAAKKLAIDDALVDAMRGRSSTWTRIRVNLRHVPEIAAKRRHRIRIAIRGSGDSGLGVRHTP